MIFPNAVYMPTLDSSVNVSYEKNSPDQSTRNFGGGVLGAAVTNHHRQ